MTFNISLGFLPSQDSFKPLEMLLMGKDRSQLSDSTLKRLTNSDCGEFAGSRHHLSSVIQSLTENLQHCNLHTPNVVFYGLYFLN